MIVVDASVLVDVLVGEGRGRPRLATEDMVAPHLLDAEVGSGIRSLVLAGDLTSRQGREALGHLGDLEIERLPHLPLLPRAFDLRANLSIYDALYVALAEALEIPLVTLDRRLAAAPVVRAVVEVIPTG